ncbi:unnamed protein product [Eruca vesicaria subsp. sativa]|uniref:Uncharacterized protein n=1 Tax=Eruca vesicaria subsp. sativa TaxID=29727 RepID=A0ABC8JMP9_ERUVS|nr:unnamed protein product [Eruca vesicaria subsp. sativa]
MSEREGETGVKMGCEMVRILGFPFTHIREWPCYSAKCVEERVFMLLGQSQFRVSLPIYVICFIKLYFSISFLEFASFLVYIGQIACQAKKYNRYDNRRVLKTESYLVSLSQTMEQK